MRFFVILRLVRVIDVLQGIGASLITALGGHFLIHWLRLALGAAAAERSDPASILFLACWASSMQIGKGLEEIRDRPATWILPGAKARLALWRVVSLGLVTVAGCALWEAIPQWRVELPLPACVGWILLAQALNPPADRPPNDRNRWVLMYLGLLVAVGLIAVLAPELAALPRQHPVEMLVIGLGAAGTNQWAWARPEMVRLLARKRLGGFSVTGAVEMADVPSPKVPGSSGDGKIWRTFRRELLLLTLAVAPLLSLFSYFLPDSVFALSSLGPGIWVYAVYAYVVFKADALRPKSCREPVSRRERLRQARLIFWTSGLAALLFGSIFPLTEEVGHAFRHGGPLLVDWHAPLYAALIVLPLLPLSIWQRIVVWNRSKVAKNVQNFAMFVLWIFAVKGMNWIGFHFSLQVCLVAASAAAAVFYVLCERSLRKHFLRGDLPTELGLAWGPAGR